MIDGVKPLNGAKLQRIGQYRDRAEELRTIAADLVHKSEQKTLLGIAATYDRLADDEAAMIEIWS